MGHCIQSRVSCQLSDDLKKIDECDGLPFENLLSTDVVRGVLQRLGIDFRERIYSPWVTLWAFLSQVISQEGTCEDAVLRVAAYRSANGKSQCSGETTSYCAARSSLPEELYSELTRQIGQQLDNQARKAWLCRGRHVKLVDGSTLTMTDTEANQEEFPQSSNQEPGVGFPLARIVVVLSLAVGSLLEAAIRASKGKKTGETTLFRELWSCFNPGDIVLADCLYDSYRDIAQLRERSVDVLFGMKQSRQRDFRRGRQLGKNDHIVMWTKPQFDKSRIDRATWEALPASMEMREVSVRVKRKGHRARTITLVTTLLDAELYPAKELADLFRQRWNCEIDLRSIKTHLGMHHLACKSPEMIRKEFWTYLLAYNLIRVRMAQASAIHGVVPRELSFMSAKKTIQSFSPIISVSSPLQARALVEAMLHYISRHRVGKRPGRSEPRAVKRRAQKHKLLTKPRHEARKALTC
jgi:hypothetical protein